MANRRRLNFLLGALCLGTAVLSSAKAGEKLVVHEWGTFTSFQDEDGIAIGGINTDDEPVPDFVHRLAYNFLLTPTEGRPRFDKGMPACHTDVTMRLETPVVYFYPDAGKSVAAFNVHVAFHGGWLTEFYPDAEARAPGLDAAQPDRVFPDMSQGAQGPHYFDSRFGHLRKDAVGELTWTNLTLGGHDPVPQTDEPVWLAPRAVAASPVKTGKGESEKFLFYRGVGNADAFLSIKLVGDKRTRLISPAAGAQAPSSRLPAPIWLVRVGDDGRCAFKRMASWPENGPPVLTVSDEFPASPGSVDDLPRLKEEMRVALTHAGLFADEANALLTTWQKSYFQSPGLRLFYLCPTAETDRLLPLSFSIPADVTRVALGRIELVTPEQRALLRKIAAGPAIRVFGWDLPLPDLYVAYLKLGRFRNALILDEQKRRPTPALRDFIANNSLGAYQPFEESALR